MSKAVYAKSIRRSKDDEGDPVVIQQKAAAVAARSRELVTVQEQVAQDKLYYKSWLVDEARAYWPAAPQMWHVEQMYPNAKGGRLLVDAPQNDFESQECELKAARYKGWGYRYLIVKVGMTTTEALKFLGEL
jgi:hypothetical protein